jgi:iron complex outermembrane receptor protein
MVRSGGLFLSFAALAVFLYGVPANAQTGRITGVVRDPQGAALSGVAVRVTNQSTNASRRATTGADGGYTVAGLAPGAYTVSVASLGLRALSKKDVQVAADAAASVDFVLQPVVLAPVTVTAMLREQPIADVPFSIAAPTAADLRSRGADNIEAIAASVPGFSVQNLGPGQSQVAMRGASPGQIARDQPGVKEDVGVYLDEVPISLSLFTPDLDLFDISRVEVLRGPQGTLFGSGSLSGTVRYISNQPELGVNSTFGEVGVNTISGGAAGNTSKLGFNVPVGDKAALRIVGYSNALGGWMDAVQPNFKINKDVNGGNRTGLRTAFRIAPNGRFSVTPGFLFQKVKMDGWNRIDAFNILSNPYTTTRPAVTLGPRQLFTQIAEPFTDEFLLGDVNMQYDLGGGMKLTSVSSYTHRYVLVVRDATALTGSVTGGSLALPPSVYELDSPLADATKSRVWTQEVRLAGGRDRLRWVVGGFYSNSRRHYGQDLFVRGFDTLSYAALGAPYGFTQGLKAPIDHLFYSDLDYSSKQTAVFGEATVGVGERLDLTGGLRYYNFNDNRGMMFDGIFTNNNTGTALVTDTGTTKANGVAPRVIASYKASDALTFNTQVSRGFRLGGINDALNVPLCTAQDLTTYSGHPTWKDETAWNYEAGAKAQVAGGRASLNVSAFYMDIRNLQMTVTAGSCSSRLTLNAPKARAQGLEAEFTASPSAHLDFSVSGSFNDAKLRSTIRDAVGNVVSGIQDGNRLPSVPRLKAAAGATYGWDVVPGSHAFVSGSFQYVGSHFTAIDDHGRGQCWPTNLPNCPFGTVDMTQFQRAGGATIGGPLTDTLFTFNPELPAYNIVNLRAGLTRESWEVAVFLDNVTDKRAFLALDRERGSRARVGYLTNQPRTFGITLRFNY